KLPIDLCVASAMLGHPAAVFRPEEFEAVVEARPSLVLLDLERPADVPMVGSLIKARCPDAVVAVLTSRGARSLVSSAEADFQLNRPISPDGLREVIQWATPAAA